MTMRPPVAFLLRSKSPNCRESLMRYELTLPFPVPEDARSIVFGLLLIGVGQVWLANARLEVIEQGEMPSS
jgi:hypothetical protein